MFPKRLRVFVSEAFESANSRGSSEKKRRTLRAVLRASWVASRSVAKVLLFPEGPYRHAPLRRTLPGIMHHDACRPTFVRFGVTGRVEHIRLR